MTLVRQFGSAAIELGAVLMTTEEIINPVIDRMWYMASRAIFCTRAACLTDRLKSIANIRTQSAVVKTQLRRKNRLMRAGHVEEAGTIAERIRAPGMGATTGESGAFVMTSPTFGVVFNGGSKVGEVQMQWA